MKKKRYYSSQLNRVLTSLITNDAVLGAVTNYFKGEMFSIPWANQIAQWCIDYYRENESAPGKAIRSIFTEYAEDHEDNDKVGLIDRYLSHLSTEAAALDELPDEYLVKQAGQFFKEQKLRKLSKDIQDFVEAKDLPAAEKAYSEYDRWDLQGPSWINPFTPEFAHAALSLEAEDASLVPFPKALGRFIGRWLVRGEFISFMAPTGRGKSFWLQEVVIRGLKARCRVLYYVVGDMTERNVAQRWVTRLARRPIRAGKIAMPTELYTTNCKEPGVDQKDVVFAQPMTVFEITKFQRMFLAKTSSSLDTARVRMRFAGAGVVSASEIEQDVVRWGRQGWPPDLVVVDYADDLKAEAHTSHLQPRDQSNKTWQVLRRIASDQDCLVVTATQGATTSYNAWLLQKRHFSEDRRKNDNVSGMIGINQTDEEKELGIYRLNWIKNRHAPWAERRYVWTAGDLAIANPCIISKLDTPVSRVTPDNKGDTGTKAPEKQKKQTR